MSFPIVNFLIGGTQKGGTTALDMYLRQHPAIRMASKKEVHWFDNDLIWRPDPTRYHSFFSFETPWELNRVAGEATPIYMYWKSAPERVASYNSDMKWILCLRNPVDRAYSHWNMERVRGREPIVSFIDALKIERQRSERFLPYQDRVHSYLDRGFYSHQICRILRFFPRRQLFFLKSEELASDTSRVLDEVCNFLGVEKMPVKTWPPLHIGSYISPMTDDQRIFLSELYREEIDNLEALLDWDLATWKINA